MAFTKALDSVTNHKKIRKNEINLTIRLYSIILL
jgi:hypothetical protein